MDHVEDQNLSGVEPLPAPEVLKRELAREPAATELVLETRQAIRDLLHGRDPRRLLVVVGPCSIHDPEAAVEYAGRLARLAETTRDDLVIVMRTYFEKPRTTVGWKGLINDPHCDGSCDVQAGIRLARSTLISIHALGMPCASELW